MRLEKKISRLCKAAAVGVYVGPKGGTKIGELVLLGPGQPVPAGWEVRLEIDQN